MTRPNRLKVAIDCRITDPLQGVGRAVIALAGALSASSVREQEYTFVVREDVSDWLRPHVFGSSRLETVSVPTSLRSRLKSKLRTLPGATSLWKTLRPYSKRAVSVPTSDGFLESRHFDVVHFPTQVALLTHIPSIYQPWDLQHLHLPQYFSEIEIKSRETLYRAFCRQAKYVCVQTEWGKRDLMSKLSMESEKVKVIPWGSAIEQLMPLTQSTVSATAAKLNLPEQFFFYPAVTWEHKNHQVIIRALRVLKDDHGIAVQVRFSGKATSFQRQLERLANELGVAGQIKYLGFISPEELQAVYARATAMIFPSKFEGFGLPLLEAFHAGVPVVSSNATVLPEVAQDGALYFHPNSPQELAEQMKRVLENVGLRVDLVERGRDLLSRYSIKQTVTEFQELYEQTFARACSPCIRRPSRSWLRRSDQHG
jgi:glycosyltransferase involved in cell wall biosynthesis